jgi:hypothetical protein
MHDIVGSIAPKLDVREAPSFEAPVRTVEFFGPDGVLYGRMQWLAVEAGPGFDQAMLELHARLVRPTLSSPAAVS